MSTVKVNEIQNLSENSTLQINSGLGVLNLDILNRGTSKTWGVFDGPNTNVIESLNFSSITDLGVGNYQINFTTPFATSYGFWVQTTLNPQTPGSGIRPLNQSLGSLETFQYFNQVAVDFSPTSMQANGDLA